MLLPGPQRGFLWYPVNRHQAANHKKAVRVPNNLINEMQKSLALCVKGQAAQAAHFCNACHRLFDDSGFVYRPLKQV